MKRVEVRLVDFGKEGFAWCCEFHAVNGES